MVMLLAMVDVSSWGQERGRKIRLKTREVSLGKLHPGNVAKTLIVSPDSKRVAYVAERDGKWQVSSNCGARVPTTGRP